MRGGGGSSSSNGGGLKDGFLSKCIGRGASPFGICTAAGRVRPPVSFVQLLLGAGMVSVDAFLADMLESIDGML